MGRTAVVRCTVGGEDLEMGTRWPMGGIRVRTDVEVGIEEVGGKEGGMFG